MRIAVLSESPADEAAIRILAQPLVPASIEPVDIGPLRTRGWPSVLHVLPVVIKQLHYHTLADGLIVVVDSIDSAVHIVAHEASKRSDPRCRFCQLRAVVTSTLQQLTLIAGRPALRCAVGTAVPAIEAWYLCGVNPQASEAGWASGALVRDRNELKRQVYGTPRPSLSIEISRATAESRRLAASIANLETSFPGGFGSLAVVLRGWGP